jgi:hypothetical protein
MIYWRNLIKRMMDKLLQPNELGSTIKRSTAQPSFIARLLSLPYLNITGTY